MVFELGFMDDANWISSSKKDIEEILNVADDFYTMTRSAINKNKTKILTNADHEGTVTLKFRSSSLEIIPESEPVRFLGTWIHLSLAKTRNFIKKMIVNIIDSFRTQLSLKKITNK
jgi:hypothetical protein